jgi:ABC-type multidrug transport system fused ATPase/permease subunit
MPTRVIVGRAFALIDSQSKRRLFLISALNIGIAALDAVGLLLLVPFLSYLGQGIPNSSSLTARFLSQFGATDDKSSILILAALATALFLLKGIAASLSLWLQYGILNTARHRLASRFVWAFIRAPWLVNRSIPTGEVIRASNASVASVVNGAASGAVTMIADGFVLIAIIAALAIVDPVLTLGAVFYTAVLGMVFSIVVRNRLAHYGEQVQIADQEVNTALIELVSGAREIIINDASRTFIGRFERALDRYMAGLRVINTTSGATRYALESSMIVGVALAVIVTSVIGTGQSMIVAIGIILAGGVRALPAINGLIVGFNTIRANGPGVEMLGDLFAKLGGSSAQTAEIGTGKRLSGAFSFNGVRFRYPGRNVDALHLLNFEVRAGESIGVVGRSGAGKSTLIDLLLGLVKPTAGAIDVGSGSLSAGSVDWRASIGFVPQEIFLTNGTLRENVTFGETAAITDAQVWRALRMAELESLVSELPLGVDTEVGENGARLSGGQKQRIGIARALLRSPSLLILDEATSAVDNETEALFAETLDRLRGTLTMVVVAHRLSTVRACDKIVFLDHGRLMGFGTFDSLRESNAEFSRLVELGNLD